MIDEGGERGGFARTGTADEQDQATLGHDYLAENGRQIQILDVGDLGLDVTHHHGDFVALLEDVHAKAADTWLGDRHIHLQSMHKLTLLILAHDAVGDVEDLAGRHRGLVQRT